MYHCQIKVICVVPAGLQRNKIRLSRQDVLDMLFIKDSGKRIDSTRSFPDYFKRKYLASNLVSRKVDLATGS